MLMGQILNKVLLCTPLAPASPCLKEWHKLFDKTVLNVILQSLVDAISFRARQFFQSLRELPAKRFDIVVVVDVLHNALQTGRVLCDCFGPRLSGQCFPFDAQWVTSLWRHHKLSREQYLELSLKLRLLSETCTFHFFAPAWPPLGTNLNQGRNQVKTKEALRETINF